MQARRDTLINLALLASVIFAWSTSWIALKAQTGVIAPEVSVFWRFLIAAPIAFFWAAIRKAPLRFSLRDHLAFMAMGMLIFSTNFILFYHGALFMPSGLLSVIFALASIINLVLARLIFGDAISWQIGLGGLLGFAGVVLMFWPEIARAGFASAGQGDIQGSILTGLALCIAGTLCFCSGNMVSTALSRRAMPVLGATSWGMAYGTLWAGLLGLVQGARFTLEWTWPYLAGLAWLSTVASVGAFLTYFTLLGRVGAARAGYATVLFPVFALLISAIFEGYQITLLSGIGLGFVALGNLLVLRR